MAKATSRLVLALLGASLLASFVGMPAPESFAKPAENPYEGCCGAEPVVFPTATGKIFIPNVFTPNDDGINDLFYPVVEGEMSTIVNFSIWSVETDSVLFQKESLNPFSPALENDVLPDGWDGKVLDGMPFKGPFKYKMAVLDMGGGVVEIEGVACSVVCDSAAVVLKGNPNCFYPVQVGSEGNMDATQPNLEKLCFSN